MASQISEIIHQCNHVEQVLTLAGHRWKSLEARLVQAEGEFLRRRCSSWKRWFNLEEQDLENDFEGSVRAVVRERVNDLIVAPLYGKMRQRLSLAELPLDPLAAHSRSALAVILEDWQLRVRPVIKEAQAADAELDRRIKKTERDERKQGIVALGMQDTKKVAYLKRQRPEIWATPHDVLSKYGPCARRVAAFLEDELSDEMMDKLVESVPIVVCRAVCDWNFQKCLLDLDQLHRWWTSAKVLLEDNEQVWARVLEKEDILLRRLERSLEDVNRRKYRYSMYATFGGTSIEVMKCLVSTNTEQLPDGHLSQQAEESLALLAGVVSDMVKGLRVARYSAMWRVVDTAKDIAKQMDEENESVLLPWQAVGSEEGVQTIFKCMGVDRTTGDDAQACHLDYNDEDALLDAALVVMPRLTSLGAAAEEMRAFFSVSTDVNDVLKYLAEAVAELNEDLLGLIDDPTLEAARSWLTSWRSLGRQGLGERLNVAMNSLDLKKDADLDPEARHARRHWLAVGRGIHTLMDDPDLCHWVVAPLVSREDASGTTSPCSPLPVVSFGTARGAEKSGLDFQELAVPASPRVLPSSSLDMSRSGGQEAAVDLPPESAADDDPPASEAMSCAEPAISQPQPGPAPGPPAESPTAAARGASPDARSALGTDPFTELVPSLPALPDEPHYEPSPPTAIAEPAVLPAGSRVTLPTLQDLPSDSQGDDPSHGRRSADRGDAYPGSPNNRSAVGSKFVNGGQIVAPRPSTPNTKLAPISPIAPSSRAQPAGSRASSSRAQASVSRTQSSNSRAQNSTSRSRGSRR